jgi:diphthamide synthase (EF-2-diphthine--ammonia ligase)
MAGYDVVALVSGGKDSVLAGMMAASYGHRVVNPEPLNHQILNPKLQTLESNP